jgi:hypothetical protein
MSTIQKIVKPSELVMERAREIYEARKGVHLFSYQTPPQEFLLEALLQTIDFLHPAVSIDRDVPTIDENDSQPEYARK